MNWLATFLIIAGFYLVARKNFWGFFVQLVGCVVNVGYYFSVVYDPAIITINIVCIAINTYGVCLWVTEEEICI